MGPNILFSAIWRDRWAVSFLQKACFVEIKENSPHTSLKKLLCSNKIDCFVKKTVPTHLSKSYDFRIKSIEPI